MSSSKSQAATAALPPTPVVAAALSVLRGLRRATDAAHPPPLVLWDLVTGVARTQLMGLAVSLDLADRVREQPMSARALASACGCDVDALERALLALVSLGVFARQSDGRFGNNRVSELLCAEHPMSMRSAARYFTSESNLRAWSAFSQAIHTGEGAFKIAHGESVWSWFDAHPDECDDFARAMSLATAMVAPTLCGLYPFATRRRVCDVGGGSGTLLSEILQRNPSLHGVLCESPSVLAQAKARFASRGLTGRVTLSPGSFFDAVTEGCDTYVLKHILHDWSDAQCATILSVCRRAMRAGDELVVFELSYTRDGRRADKSLADLQMMVACEGRERSLDEYTQLMTAAGFDVTMARDAEVSAVWVGRAR
ncbi:MAG: methyltransferase [Deltaproteobacteria bacterium]|nr:methyltransferase [Deltaproteobacteria bacterium]